MRGLRHILLSVWLAVAGLSPGQLAIGAACPADDSFGHHQQPHSQEYMAAEPADTMDEETTEDVDEGGCVFFHSVLMHVSPATASPSQALFDTDPPHAMLHQLHLVALNL